MTTPLADHELEALVGADLLALVRSRKLEVVSVHRISPLYSASWIRRAFRLQLADGSSMKGHRLESEDAARRVLRLGRSLPADAFPPMLAEHGSALLSPWLEGSLLSTQPVTDAHLRRAGQIQRSVHCASIPEEVEALDRYPGVTWREDLAAKVAWLGGHGHLESDACSRVLELADAHMPPTRGVRLIHGDICPENILVDVTGSLKIVDNDAIDLHAPEFDLARTWYRWPMTDQERRVYEEGYGAEDVLASYRQHFLHWASIVLVGASEFRLRQGLHGAAEPLGRLRALVEPR